MKSHNSKLDIGEHFGSASCIDNQSNHSHMNIFNLGLTTATRTYTILQAWVSVTTLILHKNTTFYQTADSPKLTAFAPLERLVLTVTTLFLTVSTAK